MIVLDTHTWLWWDAKDPLVSSNAKRAIEEADIVGISCVSFWEIALLVEKERLKLDRDPVQWIRESLRMEGALVLELSPEIAVRSTRLDWPHRDPADRLIVATALVHDAQLVTKDGEIREFLGARAIW